jgi:pantothenate synthetase
VTLNHLKKPLKLIKKDILIAIAAKLGNVRLIDNILLQKL